jgi:Fe-Mn family superoxide dismutase
MSPNPTKEARQPTGKIAKLIDQTYGNFSEMKKWFDGEATTLFGSGYTWLCQDGTTGYLSLLNMANQDSPVTYNLNPVLVIDIWEHAYYLKHQNKRANYIDDWWKVVNWEGVNNLLDWWGKQEKHDEL